MCTNLNLGAKHFCIKRMAFFFFKLIKPLEVKNISSFNIFNAFPKPKHL